MRISDATFFLMRHYYCLFIYTTLMKINLESKTKGLFRVFLICLLFPCVTAFAQQISIQGTVIDEYGETVIGANVLQKGTTNGIITDIDGKFKLNVPGNSTLVISYIGYITQEIPVSNKTTFNIRLMEDTKKLDEVVVIGYGTVKQSEVTAAVTSLKEDKFTTTAANSSVLEMAKGKMAGVVITNSNGTDPRSGTSIQIRGVGSLRSSNSPLIVIDGVSGGDLTLVRPEDVESFSVLKDAAAAAIYGTRGAAGVVLITTKKGKAGIQKATFDYTGFISHEFVYREPEVLTAQEYRDYMASGDYNSNLMKDFGATTKWSDLLKDNSNLSQSHSLSFAGGNQATNYRGSVYYREINPIAIESDQTNWGGRINVNHLGLNERLELTASISADLRERNNVGTNGSWEQVAQRNPTEAARDENGNWIEDGAYNSSNPLRTYETQESISNRTSLLISGGAKLKIIEGLKASISGSWQQYDNTSSTYRTRDSKSSVDTYAGGGYASKSYGNDIRKTIESMVEYTRMFNDIHSLNAVGGYSYQYHVSSDFNAWNSGFLTDAFTYNNLGNGTGTTKGTAYANMGSGKSDDKLAAFFIRGNYVYDEKYQFSATYRKEGSSRFGSNKRWGNFYAISGGWVISKESFMEDFSNVDNLKIRLGYGVTGNVPGDNYIYMTTLGTGGQYPIGNTWYQTYGPNRNPNPDLKWEQKGELNLGIDFSFYNSRIGGSIDIFQRKTIDLLDEYNAQLPPFVLATVWTNVGTIENKGIELGLNSTPIQTKDFTWDLDATFYYGTNKLVSLSNDIYKSTYKEYGGLPSPGALGNAIRTVEGGSLGEFFGKRFAKFDENGKWLFYNEDNEIVTLSQITENDKAPLGNGMPKVYASLSNTLRYKGFDLTIFFRGKFGYKILNQKEIYFGNLNWLPNNVLKSAITRHKDLKDAPQYSDYYLENGDFVKLDNVTLGYSFNMKSNKWLRKVRLYATAENLATFTGYTGATPELQDTGLEPSLDGRGFYPTTTTLVFGVNIGF